MLSLKNEVFLVMKKMKNFDSKSLFSIPEMLYEFPGGNQVDGLPPVPSFSKSVNSFDPTVFDSRR